VSNFGDAEAVLIVLKIATRSLHLGAYSKAQAWLFERVKTLRIEEKVTFPHIAEQLTKFGMRSTRGKKLSAEHMLGIYKKGLLRQARLTTQDVVTLAELCFVRTAS